ncbi:MAG: hypothetical protein PVF15_03030 [Candidatus Bathyarchaeota archaeon]|jgi:hypothetical protein
MVGVHAENAHHVILRYRDKLYYVSKVNFRFKKEERMYRAIFHARGVEDDKWQDIDVEIPVKLYSILEEYARLDNSDLLLVLYIEGSGFKCRLISEKWLRQQLNVENTGKYIV